MLKGETCNTCSEDEIIKSGQTTKVGVYEITSIDDITCEHGLVEGDYCNICDK